MSNDYFKFYLKEAKKHLKNKEYDNAIECLNRIKIVNPQSFSEKIQNEQILTIFAYIYCEKKEFDKAIFNYEKILSTSPYNWKINQDLGLAYIKKGNIEIAQQYLIKAKNIRKKLIYTINTSILLIIFLIFIPLYSFIPSFLLEKIALYFISKNNYSQAENYYNAIISYENKIHKYRYNIKAEFYEKLAELYLKEKKYNLAINYYKEALHLYEIQANHFNNKLFLYNKIRCLLKLGNIYLIISDYKNTEIYYSMTINCAEEYLYKISQSDKKNILNIKQKYLKTLFIVKNFYNKQGNKIKEKQILKKIEIISK